MSEKKKFKGYWRLYLEPKIDMEKPKVALKIVSPKHGAVEFRSLGDVMWLNDWQKISENQEEE